MGKLRDAWNTTKKVANKAADYIPGASNVKGLLKDDPYQALGGPMYTTFRDAPGGLRKLGDALTPVKVNTRGPDTPGMYDGAPRDASGLKMAAARPALGDAFDDPGTSVFSGIDDYKAVFPKITGAQRMDRMKKTLAPHMDALNGLVAADGRRGMKKPEEMP